jgi:hypothetical protein
MIQHRYFARCGHTTKKILKETHEPDKQYAINYDVRVYAA